MASFSFFSLADVSRFCFLRVCFEKDSVRFLNSKNIVKLGEWKIRKTMGLWKHTSNSCHYCTFRATVPSDSIVESYSYYQLSYSPGSGNNKNMIILLWALLIISSRIKVVLMPGSRDIDTYYRYRYGIGVNRILGYFNRVLRSVPVGVADKNTRSPISISR